MLAMTWIVSASIASPIVIGLNYTPDRHKTPTFCTFYNSAYIVCSSMGSFYIPCVIMIILYWRIFQAIHARAKKHAMKMATKAAVENKTYRDVIENKSPLDNTMDNNVHNESANRLLPHGSNNDAAFVNMATTTTDTGDEDAEASVKTPLNGDREHGLPNDKSTDFILSPVSEDSHGEPGYCAPTTVEIETQFTRLSPMSPMNPLAPSPRKSPLAFKNNFVAKLKKNNSSSQEVTPRKKVVTKFNFHLRHSNKHKGKKGSLASRREKKATTTLAIVLGKLNYIYGKQITLVRVDIPVDIVSFLIDSLPVSLDIDISMHLMVWNTKYITCLEHHGIS